MHRLGTWEPSGSISLEGNGITFESQVELPAPVCMEATIVAVFDQNVSGNANRLAQ